MELFKYPAIFFFRWCVREKWILCVLNLWWHMARINFDLEPQKVVFCHAIPHKLMCFTFLVLSLASPEKKMIGSFALANHFCCCSALCRVRRNWDIFAVGHLFQSDNGIFPDFHSPIVVCVCVDASVSSGRSIDFICDNNMADAQALF